MRRTDAGRAGRGSERGRVRVPSERHVQVVWSGPRLLEHAGGRLGRGDGRLLLGTVLLAEKGACVCDDSRRVRRETNGQAVNDLIFEDAALEKDGNELVGTLLSGLGPVTIRLQRQ